MQMIFQDPYSSLNPRMTVGEIIGEGLRLHAELPTREIREASASGCGAWASSRTTCRRYPHEFSGGQRQRIGIARALILEPEFVVCDEPISALDVSVQAQVINLLDELKASMGLTMLFIAHDLSMVRYVSDRMAVMYMGALVEIGPADDVYLPAQTPYTDILVASNPEPDPESERKRQSTTITARSRPRSNIPPGCRFASRCPHVMDVCRRETPQLLSPIVDDDRRQRGLPGPLHSGVVRRPATSAPCAASTPRRCTRPAGR
jgi:oligopeptide/dipeptide ABC transporter ATP-binding protein